MFQIHLTGRSLLVITLFVVLTLAGLSLMWFVAGPVPVILTFLGFLLVVQTVRSLLSLN